MLNEIFFIYIINKMNSLNICHLCYSKYKKQYNHNVINRCKARSSKFMWMSLLS